MLTLLVAFAVSLGVTLFLVHAAKANSHLSMDHETSGPQKFHVHPVPRVGGIGIFVGLMVAVASLWLTRTRHCAGSVLATAAVATG